MIRARESSDPYAIRAHKVLDIAQRGHGDPDLIDWALSYLGDSSGSVKVPARLHNAGRKAVTA